MSFLKDGLPAKQLVSYRTRPFENWKPLTGNWPHLGVSGNQSLRQQWTTLKLHHVLEGLGPLNKNVLRFGQDRNISTTQLQPVHEFLLLFMPGESLVLHQPWNIKAQEQGLEATSPPHYNKPASFSCRRSVLPLTLQLESQKPLAMDPFRVCHLVLPRFLCTAQGTMDIRRYLCLPLNFQQMLFQTWGCKLSGDLLSFCSSWL